jgi:hypothetical protein
VFLSFRYQSYLVLFILFNNIAYFEILGVKVMGDIGIPKPIIEWTEEIRRKEKNEGFNTYVNKYKSAFYTLIHMFQPPRM